MNYFSKAKEMLANGNTLVLILAERVYTSTARGVRPLLDLLDTGEDFSASCAADKVVGRGAAFLYVLLGVKKLYAGVISSAAIEILEREGIEVEYGSLVSRILNRTGTGYCPIESTVMDINDAETALISIRNKLDELSQRS